MIFYLLIIITMLDKKELKEWMEFNGYITNETNDLWTYQTYLNYAFEHIWLEDELFCEVIDTLDIEYLITIWTLNVWDYGSIQIVVDWDAPMFWDIEATVDYIEEMYIRLCNNRYALSKTTDITCAEIG